MTLLIQLYTVKTVHLTHWGRVTHICVGNLTIIGSGNGLSPGRRQAITWTNVGILSIGPLGTNFSEMLIEIHTFSFKKIHLKMSSGKWRPFCLGLNVLRYYNPDPLSGQNMPSGKLSSGDCHKTSLMISQHWFQGWLGALSSNILFIITWANVDPVLCRHVVSPGDNE